MPEDATLPPHATQTAPQALESADAAINRRAPELEGDYRPAAGSYLDPVNARVEPGDYSFLLRLTEALNTTLDLRTLLKRTSELIRTIIQYRIFAILLLDEAGKELRMRFQIGHTPEIERMRFPLGEGVVGQVAQTRNAILINDVTKAENYITANQAVRSELAVPLINKNRVIGVWILKAKNLTTFAPNTCTCSR